jgi:thioredoxin reductase (NADPH)
VTVRDASREALRSIPCQALFVLIGAEPHTDWLDQQLATDGHGFLLTGRDLPPERLSLYGDEPPFLLETSLPGVFAVGDVRSGSVKRVAAAVGEGSMAVSFAHQRLAAPIRIDGTSPERVR